jgi:hypothetical protein
MKRATILLALGLALSGAACEINTFCMSAGAPSGLVLVVKNTPAGPVCAYQTIADTIPRPTPQGGQPTPN